MDLDQDENPGVTYAKGITPSKDEYGDMLTDERPEDDDEEAVDKYLNMELNMNVGTSDEQRGRVIKRA
jgi:hypothetical protein